MSDAKKIPMLKSNKVFEGRLKNFFEFFTKELLPIGPPSPL